MSLIHDLRATPRLGILVAVAAATVGIIYGYDSVEHRRRAALHHRRVRPLHRPAAAGHHRRRRRRGARRGRRWRAGQPDRPQTVDGAGRGHLRRVLPAVRAGLLGADAARRPIPAGPDDRHLGGRGARSSWPSRAAQGPRRDAGRLPGRHGRSASSAVTSSPGPWPTPGAGAGCWARRRPAVAGLPVAAPAARHRALVHDARPASRGAPPCCPGSSPRPMSTAELDDIERADRGEGDAARDLREMLRKPFLRATVFVVGLGFFVQITGINAIVYYSPRIFQAMGFEGNFALLGLPALVQVAGLAAVFVSMFLVDRLGRRPILLTRHRHHDHRQHLAGRRLHGRLRLRRRAHRPRFPRRAAVHRGVHVRLRRPRLGVRR